MRWSDDHKEVRMTLHEWDRLRVLPRNFWQSSQKNPHVIDWLSKWPKRWRWQTDTGIWMITYLHIGRHGRTYFYHARIYLRPTIEELTYIAHERYRIGQEYSYSGPGEFIPFMTMPGQVLE